MVFGKLIQTLMIIVVIFVSTSTFSQGLVANYKFEELSGNILHDETEFRNDGVITGIMEHDKGICGYDNAYKFNGIGNQYVTVHSSTSLKVMNNITFNAWIKFNSLKGKAQTFIEKGKQYIGFEYNFGLTSSNKLHFCFYNPVAGFWRDFIDNSDWVPMVGDWNMVTIQVDKPNKKVSFYVNGVPKGIIENANLDYVSTDYNMYIGRHDPLNSNPDALNGVLDELSIFHNLLSDNEVTGLYNNLAAYYKFDETSGTIVNDASGRVNNGTIVGTMGYIGGKINGAYKFDGSGKQYVTVNNSASLKFSNSMTFNTWVKIDALKGTYQAFIQKGKTPFNTDYNFGLTNQNKLRFCFYSSANRYWREFIDSSAWVPTIGVWNMVTITVNKSSKCNMVRFFVNGVCKSSVYGALDYLSSDYNMYIGIGDQNNGITPSALNGALDEVRLYNIVISDYKIQDLYKGLSKRFEGDTLLRSEETVATDLTVSPNPCNPSTQITLPNRIDPKNAQVHIINIQGKEVASYYNLTSNKIVWNANKCPSGMYVVKIIADNTILSKKVSLIK